MPGTVTGTIGNNAGVYFTYAGNGGASGIHLDIGFQPSCMEFRASTNTNAWGWTSPYPYAWIATAASWAVDTAGGVGRVIGTVTNISSITGVQIGTDTIINGGQTYRGMCWR